VDNSEAMVTRFREVLHSDQSTLAVDVICADIRDVVIEDASVGC
jgi:tRNA (cmo5U34)-methyltransferase